MQLQRFTMLCLYTQFSSIWSQELLEKTTRKNPKIPSLCWVLIYHTRIQLTISKCFTKSLIDLQNNHHKYQKIILISIELWYSWKPELLPAQVFRAGKLITLGTQSNVVWHARQPEHVGHGKGFLSIQNEKFPIDL